VAKTTGPLLSFGAHGKLARTQIHQRSKSRNVVKSFAAPSNPQSPGQVSDRSLITQAVLSWRSFQQDPSVLTAWTNATHMFSRQLTGYNVAIGALKRALSLTPQPAFHSAPATRTKTMVFVPMANMLTGAAIHESGMFDIYLGTTRSNLRRASAGSMSGSTLFAPLTIGPPVTTNLLAWYDPGQIYDLADAANVAALRDSSGNDHDMSEAAAGRGPTYREVDTADRPAVQFNGTTEYMRTPKFLCGFPDLHFYAVFHLPSHIDYRSLLTQDRTAALAREGEAFLTGSAPGKMSFVQWNPPGTRLSANSTAPATTGPRVHHAWLDATGGHLTQDGLYLDNKATMGAWLNIPAVQYTLLGAIYEDSPGSFSNAYLNEMLIYAQVLSQEKQDSLASYLTRKFLPPSQPYDPYANKFIQVYKNGVPRSGVIPVPA